MIKKLTLFFLLISGYASAQLPDSTVISGGTAFNPAWRFKGANASNSFMQFQNPLTGKYFGFYSAFQQDQRFQPAGSYVTTNTNQITPGITGAKAWRSASYFLPVFTGSGSKNGIEITADFTGQTDGIGYALAINRTASSSTALQGIISAQYNGDPRLRLYNIGGLSSVGGVNVGSFDSLAAPGLKLSYATTTGLLKIGTDKLVVPAIAGTDYALPTNGIQNQFATNQSFTYRVTGPAAINVPNSQPTGKYYAVGDSFTFGTGATSDLRRYSTLVADGLRLTEVNLGSPGRTMQAYVVTDVTPIKSTDGRYVTLYLGVNDLNSTEAAYPKAQFQADFITTINRLIAHGWAASDILVPNIAYKGTPTTRQTDLNTAILNAVTSTGVNFLDIYSITQAAGGANLTADGLHPNNQGHYLTAVSMLNKIRTSFGYSDQTFAANGISEFNALRINPFNNLSQNTNKYILGTDTVGNVGVLTALPSGVRADGDIITRGGIVNADALIPSGITNGDYVLPPGGSLSSATVSTAQIGRLIPISTAGHTEIRNYYSGGRIDFIVSNGVNGTQSTAVSISPTRVLTANNGISIPNNTKISSTATYENSYFPSAGSGQSEFYNRYATLGGFNWYTSSVNNTPVMTKKQFSSGSEQWNPTGVNQSAESISALADFQTTTKGLLIPRMTTTQREAIAKESIIGLSVTNGGTGYTNGGIVFTGGGGTGFAATAVTSGGVVTSVTILGVGTGYTSAPSYSLNTGTGLVLSFTFGWKEGLMIYNTTTSRLNQVVNGVWQPVAYTSDLGASLVSSFRNITSATTLLATDATINVTSGTFTQALSTTNLVAGQEIYVKNSGTGTVTVTATSMDGQTSVALQQYDGLTLQYTGVTGTFIIK